MTQSKADLESWYQRRDPWDLMQSADDHYRRRCILSVLSMYGPFERALDIGAGEGFISGSLPADEINGYEISDTAAARFPPHVHRTLHPTGRANYDLVLATGILYQQYDWQLFVDMIKTHASDVILTCNIATWEVPQAIAEIPGRQVVDMTFAYREFTQRLRVFKV